VDEMMSGGMMWRMGIGGLIVLAAVLVIAALVKFVFFKTS
jgi:archaellin